ncbi:hypothetical protein [Spirosoma utsteinense]|uniref:Outer membrane protein beta-barrel domain-containing protein n=1 Tax=Spirosoma utsteinense TaxID=2585773 RepID=A0ABR6WBD9_9BACT|nr:hypothetical protein [Spirosoma utsteinense]MBC3785307.1 hypothetical protein [Spirosoma utsteinense]MBC3793889.1 hypothetical protein [Spirosoma utsteinense]
MISFLRRASAIFTLLVVFTASSQAQFRLDLESGVVVGTTYNEVRIPNTGGTRFDLSDELTAKPTVFYRVRAGYTFGNRHTISALYAPLTVRYTGQFSQDVNYNDVRYPAAQPLTAFYQFNSYRLTYRYDVVARERWRVGVGLTAKIRDASIRLRGESNSLDTRFDDLGFVPLLNVYVAYQPDDHWRLLLEGDALGSTFGRAEDIFAGAVYQLNDRLGFKAGYRVVEGGANVDTIYNFTWINYASAGILLTL